MMVRLLAIGLIFFCPIVKSYAQEPDYYFFIDKVFWTSQSFSKEDKEFKYRVLALKPAEFYFLAVELYEVPSQEFGKGKLIESFYIHDREFESASNNEVIVLDDVELINWVSSDNVELRVNKKYCFSITLSPEKENLKITKCN